MNSTLPLIKILLSTFNGEQYLPQLLDSILTQTYTNFQVFIRDDNSLDSTKDIIRKYHSKYPDKIIILEFSKENSGHTKSFALLLEAVHGEYIAFCDQDDIWVQDKLEHQMFELKALENEIGNQIPILVHSDLKVCDHNMNPVSDSMWKYQKILPDQIKEIRYLLVQNFVTGCTILINRALADIVVPTPKQAVMFDWWVALLALEQGEIISIQKPLVMYRQHMKNAVGAKKWGLAYLISMAAGKNIKWRTTLKNTVFQAKALEKYANNEDRGIICQYGMFDKMGWVKRKILYWRIGIKKYGWLRQITAWLFI